MFAAGQLPSLPDCVSRIEATYPRLRDLHGPFTKALFLAPSPTPGAFTCRFVQLPADLAAGRGAITGGRDCINSVLAAYDTGRYLTHLTTGWPAPELTFLNPDTGTTVSAWTGSRPATINIQVHLRAATDPATTLLPLPETDPALVAIGISNPYLLLNAACTGLDRRHLLALEGPAEPGILARLEPAARHLRESLNLPADLPKTALLLRDGHEIVARTVYLGHWHPGLPLSGALTFATAVLLPGSPWRLPGARDDRLLVRGPHACVQVRLACRASDGTITSFLFSDRSVSTHAERIPT